MGNFITYVGLDVHKKNISVAFADQDGTEVRPYGIIESKLSALDKVTRKLVSRGSEPRFVYEAGPCGYGIYRHLKKQSIECMVAAPSLIPKKSGERIKNDRRDAKNLARLYRAGELTAVHVPDTEDEAMRDLTRAREDAKIEERKARQHLSALLLRHGYIYSGKSNWTLAHWRWISDIKMEHEAQQFTLQEYVDTARSCSERVERITEKIRLLVGNWRFAPVVEALQSLKGVSLVISATVIAEIGDLSRFGNPRDLMAFLGLIPSQDSSGEKTKLGRITRTGNGHARRMLVQAAWSYRTTARVSRRLLDRQQNISERIWKIAWKAQVRLCARYQRLIARGKPCQLAITAIARELVGFIWAIFRTVEV
ncbi:MAG: IS110 family transposase [Syntrophobacteraceae bacterium]